jgi:aspartate/methionine/tyrosine aminotransferase
MKPLSARVADLRPTAVNRVLAESRQVQAEGKALVSLMRGQPDTPTNPIIVEAAVRALRDGRTGYPDNQGEPRLRDAIALKLQRDHGLTYSPSEILVTDGATMGIAAALAVLLQPGDEVLIPDPIYDAYGSVIALWGGRPVPVPATIRDGRFTLERAALEASHTPRSKLLLLNTPWNPVGSVLSAEELRGILAFAEERDLWLLSDEIYETLIYDGRRHISPASLSDEARRRTILVNSLSKTYAMTGWRVGYCAGPAGVIAAMLLVLQQASRGPATFVQDAAAFALRMDQAPVRRMAAEYQGRRDQVVEALRGIPGVMPLVPEGGLFVMADVSGLGKSSDEVRRWLLREAGLVLIHGAAFGSGGEGTLRVSFAAGGETLQRGLACLRSGLTSFPASKAGCQQRP